MKRLLLDYLEGTIDSDMAQVCSQHLESCASCRDELEGIKAVISTAREIPAPEYPAEFWQRQYQKLQKDAHHWNRHRRFVWGVRFGLVFALFISFTLFAWRIFVPAPTDGLHHKAGIQIMPITLSNIPTERTIVMPDEDFTRIADFASQEDQIRILAELLY